GANPFLAGQHQVSNLKPGSQWIVGILKDGLSNDRKSVAVPSATLLTLADPMKRTALHSKYLGIVAARAAHNAVFPAPLLQELFAGVFILEGIHQLGKCLFHGLASVMLKLVYRSSTVVSSRL